MVDSGTATGRVMLAGRLDAVEAPELRGKLLALLAEGCRNLLVDLSELDFVDSAGLAVLVRARRDTQAVGGDLVLVRPSNDDAMRVFRLTHFDRIFTMLDTAPPAGAP